MKKDASPSGFPESSGEKKRLEILLDLTQALLREVVAMQSEDISLREEIDLAKEIEAYEVDLIRGALKQTGGRQIHAARLLNVKASTLHAKIKRYRILENIRIVA
jgi:transcriptional regulator with GAF, ATPase, and Fis domain